jgi:hypothetical protein
MILEVNHKISPGTFTTNFTGVRQNASEVPPVDPLQVLKTNLLQSIKDTFKTQKDKENNQSNTNTAEKNKINGKTEISDSNTLSINQNCLPNNAYNTYTNINPTIRKINDMDMIKKINEILDDGSLSLKLQITIFSYLYLNSYSGDVFKAYDYNFGSVTLEENWKELGNQYFKPNFYCSYTERPMATFESLDKLISMLRDKWKNIVNGQIKKIDKKEITKFLITYSTYQKNNSYTKFSKEDLSILENDYVQKSIDLFNSASQGISP